jgi:hypothetical protein
MTNTTGIQTRRPLWQKLLFRFFFIYWIVYIAPWTWLGVIPGVDYVMNFYYEGIDWLVRAANRLIFHIKDELVPLSGSGDTSFGWAQLCAYLLIAIVGLVIWSFLDRKRKDYKQLNYWLCLVVRYNIALTCLSYGFIKIFHLQMPFPSNSQLATPLGDLLPMRLSWMFMGYSDLYQGFSGVLELIAGFLLFYRRTTNVGSLMAAGVFLNVAMLNLGYDIPVKLFSIHVLLMCVFLLAIDHRRLIQFFVLNKTAGPSVLYDYTPGKKWMRISKTALKAAVVLYFGISNIYESIGWYKETAAQKAIPPLQAGLYDVSVFAVNHDTLPALYGDTVRWQNMAIDPDGAGSLNITDTSFSQRYSRSYFAYEADTVSRVIQFKRFSAAEYPVFTMRYAIIDTNTISLWGKRGADSLYVLLRKSNRHFRLAEKQFHWLSESNR